jgi:Xaa-Pro aminopeptidase
LNSSEAHSPRLARIRELLTARHIDALLVTDMSNVFYLSGFTGSTAALVVTSSESHILVDPRYSIQARNECPSACVRDYSGKRTVEAAAELILELGSHTLGYEADDLTVDAFRLVQDRLQGSLKLRSTRGVVRRLRQIKDAHEVSLIRRAAQITDAAYEAVLPKVKPGMSEKQLALMIDSAMRSIGADREGFDTIAASGPNSACPHAHPTDRILQAGDMVKMDFGARYARYNADITRTICLGKPDRRQEEVYNVVLEAQSKALEAIAPGVSCKEIDSVARNHIVAAGFGDNFGHGLGHSFGIEVHEEPRFSQTCDAMLEPGMVMTVEPGVYIEGWGGVRIEDDVLITDTACEILTRAPKGLGSI